jgi:serpin B
MTDNVLAETPNPRPDGVSLQSDLPRQAAPDAPAGDLAELVAGSSAFALDLYGALRAAPGNLFFSPYSISLALAMAYAGARARTEQQMAGTLHFTLSQERMHPAFNALDQELAGRGAGARGKDGAGFRLNIANALWGQEGYQFLKPFLDTLAVHYGAGLRLLDFAGTPEASRVAINNWVSDQTEGRIEDLIPPGLIDSLTRLVLTNAIYFNAAWASPFAAHLTQDGPFFLLDGTPVETPMMRQVETFGYAAGPGFQAVELPCDGHELAMLILVPDAGQFDSLEQALDAAVLYEALSQLQRRRLALSLPLFKVESQFSLGAILSGLGMPDAFGDQADFSAMEPRGELSITDVVHQAFVAVDEAGTEAAAATAVIMMTRAMMPVDPLEVTIDRPFFFVIRDLQSGAVLFAGRLVDPSG